MADIKQNQEVMIQPYTFAKRSSVFMKVEFVIILLIILIGVVQTEEAWSKYNFVIPCNPKAIYKCTYSMKSNQNASVTTKYFIPDKNEKSPRAIRCIPDYKNICSLLKAGKKRIKEYITYKNNDNANAYYNCEKTSNIPSSTWSLRNQESYGESTEFCLYASDTTVSTQDGSFDKRDTSSRIQHKTPDIEEHICHGYGGKKYIYYLSEEDVCFNVYDDKDRVKATVITELYRSCIRKDQICSIIFSTKESECTRRVQAIYNSYHKCLNETNKNNGINNSDSANSIIETAEKITSSEVLKGDEIMAVSDMLKQVALKTTNSIVRLTPVDNRDMQNTTYKLLSGVVKVCSNLLNAVNEDSWKSLSDTDQKQAATSVLAAVEQTAFNMAGNVNQENIIEVNGKNILVSVRVLNASGVIDQDFLPMSSKEKWTTYGNSIQLSKEALADYNEKGLVRIVFMIFDGLSNVMQPQITHESLLGEKLVMENSESEYDIKNGTRVINSNIISACINDAKRSHLLKPVTFTLSHLRQNIANPSCVYWNETLSVWLSDGCTVKWTNTSHTGCECIHLTNFAVLMDVNSVPLSSSHVLALHLITVIGCTISVLALFAATIIFHCFKGMKSDRILIHKNLCACLLIAEIIFLFGIEKTKNQILCGFIAAFLQYFFLAAFCWMFLEGFQLYAMLIEVFEPEHDRSRWYYLVAYVTPLIIVGISAIVDHTSYGTSQLCWLRSDNYFILSFMVPVAIILSANWSSLFMVVYTMCRHSDAMKAKANSQRIKIWLRSSIFLAILLGLTWTFGLLYLNEQTIFMAYVFSVLNSLQGLFIFIFHCLLNETFQKECRRLGRDHSWLSWCPSLTAESTSLTMTGNSTAQHSKLSAKSSASLNYGSSFKINDSNCKNLTSSRTHEVIFAERFILGVDGCHECCNKAWKFVKKDHKPSPILPKNGTTVKDMNIKIEAFANNQAMDLKNINDRPLLSDENKLNVLSFNQIPKETIDTKNEDILYDIPNAAVQMSKQGTIIPVREVFDKKFMKVNENEEFVADNEYAVYKTESHSEPETKEIIQIKNEYDVYNKEYIQPFHEKEVKTENEYAVYKTENHMVLEKKEILQIENEYDVYSEEFSHSFPENEEVETENEYAVYKVGNHLVPERKEMIQTENEYDVYNKESSHDPINEIEKENEYANNETENHSIPKIIDTLQLENEYDVYSKEISHRLPGYEEIETENEYAVYKTETY